MPSWNIHLATASQLLSQNITKTIDVDAFLIGNILPDILNGLSIKNPSIIIPHQKTHYYHNKNEDVNLPNMKHFIKKYPKFYQNDVLLGYFTHLLTDYLYNSYFINHFQENEHYTNENKQHDFIKFGNEEMIEHILIPKYNDDILIQCQKILPVDKNDILQAIIFLKEKRDIQQDEYILFSKDELYYLFYQNTFLISAVVKYYIKKRGEK